jgi:hypothetical protein
LLPQPFIWNEMQRYGEEMVEAEGLSTGGGAPTVARWEVEGVWHEGTAAKLDSLLGEVNRRFVSAEARYALERPFDPLWR